MTTYQRPVFAELSRDDSIALLERHHLGRLAFTFHHRVDIEPISYIYADSWLYVRTSPGRKLATVKHHPWVAFEVDEVESRFDWRSVVVRGTIYLLDPERDRDDYHAAVAVIRTIDADALSDADATPHRQALFRIHADEITGRAATSNSSP